MVPLKNAWIVSAPPIPPRLCYGKTDGDKNSLALPSGPPPTARPSPTTSRASSSGPSPAPPTPRRATRAPTSGSPPGRRSTASTPPPGSRSRAPTSSPSPPPSSPPSRRCSARAKRLAQNQSLELLEFLLLLFCFTKEGRERGKGYGTLGHVTSSCT